jgi:hypothetical protein
MDQYPLPTNRALYMFPSPAEVRRLTKAMCHAWDTQPVLVVSAMHQDVTHETDAIAPQLYLRNTGKTMKPLCATFDVEIDDKLRQRNLFHPSLSLAEQRKNQEHMETWDFDSWKLVAWCNGMAAQYIPEDAEIVIQSWTRVEKGNQVVTEIEELPEQGRAPPLFLNEIENCPGLTMLPWTEGTRWVCDPNDYAMVDRNDTGLYATDGGIPDKSLIPTWAMALDRVQWCTAAIVTDARWDEDPLDVTSMIVRTMEGTTQECEAYAFLEMIAQAVHTPRKRNIFVVDSMACYYMFVAASGGAWGPVVKRGLAPYAIVAKQFLDSPQLSDTQIGLLKATSHGQMISNRSCDICTDKWSDMVFTWCESPQAIVVHAVGLDREYRVNRAVRQAARQEAIRKMTLHPNSGWRANLKLSEHLGLENFQFR